jgi:aspartate/tyrosine/aromatic aminotransferase
METTKSLFDEVKATQWDPIIEILEEYRLCPEPNKINLTVGAYRDKYLQPVVFRCVKKAEERVFSKKFSRAYLPPTGDEEFNKVTQYSIFPKGHEIYEKNQILTVQSLSGGGEIRLCAEFISKFITKSIYVPHLTWPNHNLIFSMSWLDNLIYRFYDPETNCYNNELVLEDLAKAEEGSVVLLHVCSNNPTGADPSEEDWNKIAELMKKKNLIPFFDMAYQGFITGDIMKDSYPIHLFYGMGFEMFIAQSFSKSMGLYGERAGPLHIITHEPETIPNIKSQLADLALGLYLTPVGHGARIIKEVLGDDELRKDWELELKECVDRLNYVRRKLYDTLVKIGTPGSWVHIMKQNGMFCYTGLNLKQCEALIKEHKIFLVKTGRISLCGLNDDNVEKVAEGIKDVVIRYSS